ncbi:MAG: DUF6448 family protein [Longimicrobiales bacterium]|nr:DUF6448 family protein [Longimicrobiales bacterium]
MLATSLVNPTPVAAHCDSMNGPVVKAARAALAAGNVDLVLVWVQPGDEKEIREAFARTQRVRGAGGEAQKLADYWFFETLVRVHRSGEGAPYTGLKGPDYEIPAGIAAADRAVEGGALEGLDEQMAEHVLDALRGKFDELASLQGYAQDDVETGRKFVHAYVEFIHFVENLHGLIEGGAAAHPHG